MQYAIACHRCFAAVDAQLIPDDRGGWRRGGGGAARAPFVPRSAPSPATSKPHHGMVWIGKQQGQHVHTYNSAD